MSGYPLPPEDPDIRNIIDKLANFVARNGPEFEEMTKSKQSSNPKFSFLFGGEHHAYYKWKVATEQGGMYGQAPIQQQQQQTVSGGATSGGDTGAEEDSLIVKLERVKRDQQAALEHSGMIDALEEEFISTIKPLMDSCTKDAIASGKSWIISHAVTPEDCNKIAHYLMRKTLDSKDTVFSHKLHVIYLINDLMFHCQRKKSSDLHEAIEASIVQIFYNARAGQSDENKDKLVKVLNIWEGQKYFSEAVIQQINHVIDKAKVSPDNPPPAKPLDEPQKVAWQPLQGASDPPPLMQSGNPPPLIPVTPWKPVQPDAEQVPPPPWQQTNPPPIPELPPWKQQPPPEIPPPPWIQQSNQSIPLPPWQQQQPQQQQPQQPQQQDLPPWQQPSNQGPPPPWQQQPQPQDPPHWPSPSNQGPPPPPWQQQQPQQQQQQQQDSSPWQPPSNQGPPPPWLPPSEGPDQGVQDHGQWHNQDRNIPPWKTGLDQGRETPPWQGERAPWQQGPPPHFQPPPWPVPRHPEPHPPLFDRHPPPDWREGPHPPIGAPPIRGPPPPLLEAPRGPPPVKDPPQSQPPPPNIPYFDLPAGLMAPLVPLEEHSYKSVDPSLVRLPPPQPPSEKLLAAVEEFYKPATPDKPRNEEGWEAKALLNFFDSKLKAQQKTSSRGRRRKRSRSRSRSYSRSRSRSRSNSPQYRRSSRSASPHSRSPSPRSRRRSRSRSPFIPTVPSRRSPSPEQPKLGFGSSAYDSRLAEENIGHQMLKRMGWEGAGLGSKQQGLQEPVKSGDVRDKTDKYKGVGMETNTPFDEFRKRKSYVYNQQPPPAAQSRH